MQIIAHRGASHDAPENTLAAVQLAWDQGADAVEVDIMLSADHQVVVFHDDRTDRIGGRDLKVSRQTIAELRQLDAGAWKDARWKGERIPTLAEVLATVPMSKTLVVEIKCGIEILAPLKTLLKTFRPVPQLVFIGFDFEVVRAARQIFPSIPSLWIVEVEQGVVGARPAVDELLGGVKLGNFDGLDLNGEAAIPAELVRRLHRLHKRLYIWTVDDPSRARELRDLGVDGLTTNRPGWMRAELAKPPPPGWPIG